MACWIMLLTITLVVEEAVARREGDSPPINVSFFVPSKNESQISSSNFTGVPSPIESVYVTPVTCFQVRILLHYPKPMPNDSSVHFLVNITDEKNAKDTWESWKNTTAFYYNTTEWKPNTLYRLAVRACYKSNSTKSCSQAFNETVNASRLAATDPSLVPPLLDDVYQDFESFSKVRIRWRPYDLPHVDIAVESTYTGFSGSSSWRRQDTSTNCNFKLIPPKCIFTLKSFRSYRYRLSAISWCGVNATTLPWFNPSGYTFPGGEARNFVAENAAYGVVKLSWLYPRYGPRKLYKYDVQYDQSRSRNAYYDMKRERVKGGLTINISGLRRNTAYRFQVIASINGLSAFPSPDVVIRTYSIHPDDIPRPDNVEETGKGFTWISIEWTIVLTNISRTIPFSFSVSYQPVIELPLPPTRSPLSVNETSLNITNLANCTKYRIIVTTTVRQGGRLPKGMVVELSTMKTEPKVKLNVTCIAVNSTALLVSWMIGDTTTISCPPDGVYLFVSSKSEDIFNRTLKDLDSIDVVGGLLPWTNYSVAVQLFTSAVGPANHVTCRTSQDAPTAAPEITKIITSPAAVSIEWKSVPEGDRNGIILGYRLNISSPLFSVAKENISGEATNCTVDTRRSLPPYYELYVALTAFTVAGDSPTSTKPARMPPKAPSGPPTDISVSAITSTSLTVHWSPPSPENRNGLIEAYQIEAKGLGSSEKMRTAIVPWFVRSHQFVNLRDNTSYLITVSAATHAGFGEQGKFPVSTHFAPSPPPPPHATTAAVATTGPVLGGLKVTLNQSGLVAGCVASVALLVVTVSFVTCYWRRKRGNRRRRPSDCDKSTNKDHATGERRSDCPDIVPQEEEEGEEEEDGQTAEIGNAVETKNVLENKLEALSGPCVVVADVHNSPSPSPRVVGSPKESEV